MREVEVPLNDSLTSFRIVAIAGAEAGVFGTGAATIRSTQDLQLFSGDVANRAPGDSFAAEFTMRNASERPFEAAVAGTVEGLATQPLAAKDQPRPGDGKTSAGISRCRRQRRATEVSRRCGGAERAVGPSRESRSRSSRRCRCAPGRRRWCNSTSRFRSRSRFQRTRSRDQGGVAVRLSPSLTAGLGGIEAWMRAYPYVCLEQRVSRAVALKDPALWRGNRRRLPSYTDADGLLKYFPVDAEGSDVLTSYVLAIANEAGLTIPDRCAEPRWKRR